MKRLVKTLVYESDGPNRTLCVRINICDHTRFPKVVQIELQSGEIASSQHFFQAVGQFD